MADRARELMDEHDFRGCVMLCAQENEAAAYERRPFYWFEVGRQFLDGLLNRGMQPSRNLIEVTACCVLNCIKAELDE